MNYRVCFAAYLRRQGKRPATIKTYSYALADFRAYCRPAGKRVNIRKHMQPRQLESYKEYLLNSRGLRPSTVNCRLTALSAFARFLLGRGILDYNPLELLARVRSNERWRIRPQASWEDVQKLRREVNQDVLDLEGRLIVELLYTGMTVRDLCSLRWEGQAGEDGIRIGERKIRLHPEARLALEHYLILRPILLGSYLIVGNGEGWALKPGTVYAVIKRLAKRIDAPVSVRDLRLARFTQLPGVLAPASAARKGIAA